MSEHTKTRRTSRFGKKSSQKAKKEEKSIPWRKVAKENIEKYTEAGLALRGARYKKGWTQQKLADAIGVRAHHISEMENGKRTIGKAMARRLAEVLNVKYKVFL